MSIVVDSCGSIFVTDSSHTIRKIFIQKGSPTVTLVTTFAGSGIPGFLDTSGQTVPGFSSPQGLAIDADNNLYVADMNNHAIRKITPLGIVSTIAGNGYPGYNDGIGRSAIFNTPTGLVLDSRGNIFVADKNNSLIRKIAPDGAVTTVAGTVGTTGNTDAVGTLAKFRNPSGLAIDSDGNLYVADTDNNLIRKIAPNAAVTTIAGKVGPAFFTNGVGSCGRFNSPTSIAIDTNGTLYVCDRYNNAIRQITITSGTPRTGCGTNNPGIATVTTLAGAGNAGYVAGVGASAQFNTPHGIFIDLTGNLYVADTMNSSIRMITLSTPRLPPPTTCLTLCTPCCNGLQAVSGSKFCSPYPGYVMNSSGAVAGIARGLTTGVLHPFYTGGLNDGAWLSALDITFSRLYGRALVVSLGYFSVLMTGSTLHMFPGWVAFGYINLSPLAKMELDLTPYTGTTLLRTNTFFLLVVSESDLTYTPVKPYSNPTSTSFINVPTMSYRRSTSGPLLSEPIPQVICGDGGTTC
jgi:sugar lactone lactonase YvrE